MRQELHNSIDESVQRGSGAGVSEDPRLAARRAHKSDLVEDFAWRA